MGGVPGKAPVVFPVIPTRIRREPRSVFERMLATLLRWEITVNGTSVQLDRARAAVAAAGQEACELGASWQTKDGCVTLSTMHLMKGLESQAVVVMAVDEDVIPDPDRIDGMADLSQLPDLYEPERHLPYVACTRARDRLLITCAGEPNKFIGDIVG